MTRATDDELRERIRAVGLRCTGARVAVLRHLHGAATPLTHNEVVAALREAGFDQSTLYRNLVDLAQAGLIRRRELGDHAWRYESLDGHDDGHAHFLCVDCGGVSCLPEVRLDMPSRDAAAKVGAVTEVLIKGHCTECGTAG